MVNELTKLYNTLMLIETKGESTKLMGQCLNFTQGLINHAAAEQSAQNTQATEENADD